jgi:hypothetical protein
MGSSIPAAKALIDSSREPFYVIRKGDVIGVYKNLSDCQAQASKSVRAIDRPFLLLPPALIAYFFLMRYQMYPAPT